LGSNLIFGFQLFSIIVESFAEVKTISFYKSLYDERGKEGERENLFMREHCVHICKKAQIMKAVCFFNI
jgi:hypothetical protein